MDTAGSMVRQNQNQLKHQKLKSKQNYVNQYKHKLIDSDYILQLSQVF